MMILVALNYWLERLLKVALVTMTIVMLLVLAAQVFMRYFFGVALSWSEELALTLFTWTVLLASAYGIRQGTHVRMTILLDRFSGLSREVAERIIHFVTALVGAYLCYAGWTYLVEADGMTSAAIGFPLEYLYAAGPVTGLLMTLFALELGVGARAIVAKEPGHV